MSWLRPNDADDDGRFIGAEQIEEAVDEMADLAATQGAKAALAGGVAMHIHGSPRMTADIDLIADEPIMPADFEEPLTFGGMRGRTAQGIPVDVIVRDDEYASLYEDALFHSRRRRGSPMPIVPAPYLAAMKFVAHRPKDLSDAQFLLTQDKVDPERVRGLLLEHAPNLIEDWEAFVDETEWQHEAGLLQW